MGIQINGQTDTVSTTSVGGKVTIPTADFPSVNSLNVSGVATATSFSGPLTGNVTGNLSGNVTGNLNSTGVSTITTLSSTSIVGVNTIGVAQTAYVGSINDGPISGARNRIINGDMRIDQRNNGASVSASGNFPVDRWLANWTSGAFTMQRVADAPVGFTSSIRFTVTTADVSVTGDEYLQCYQMIEGFNASDLLWGTVNAKPITVSFYVKSNIIGTYGFSMRDNSAAYSYPANITINSPNTWEYKTITIPGPTVGTWNTDNTRWGYVTFTLYQGPSAQGTANTWVNANARSTTTISNTWPATIGNTFSFTGVQLEAGTVATPFERRSYGQELALCQRYYETSGGNQGSSVFYSGNTTSGLSYYTANRFIVTKRAIPIVATTHVVVSGFPATASSVSNIDIAGFRADRLCNVTTNGAFFIDNWVASAEL